MTTLFKKNKESKKKIHDDVVELLDEAIDQLNISIANLKRVRNQAMFLREEHAREMKEDD